jgi:Skp family chaperone for outer membrane proteins
MSSKQAVKKSASVSAPVVTATPVVASTPATKKVARASSTVPVPVAATPVVAPSSRSTSPAAAAVATPAAAAAAAEAPAEEERSLQDEIKAVQDQLNVIRDAVTSALTALKRVAKRATLDVKDARKNRRKVKEDNGEPRKPSNFEIPVAISDELSAFFGGGKTATMSRAEVNKRMFAFAKENFLSEGQTIHLESTPALVTKGFKQSAADSLRRLLAIPQGESLTIFNIQKYMGRHYSKPAATA